MLRNFSVIPALLFALTLPALGLAQDLLQQAIDHFEAGRHDQAEAIFRQITAADAPAPMAYAYLGRIAIERKDYSDGIDLLDESIDLASDNADYYLWLADGYVGLINNANLFKQAYYATKIKGAFETAAALDPAHLRAQTSLAEFYLGAPAVMGGGIKKAKAQVDVVAGLDSLTAFSLYARIAIREGDNDLAISYYRMRLDRDPTNPNAHYGLGMFLQSLKRWDEALTAFDAAIAIEGTHMASLYQIGRTVVFSKANLPRGIAAMQQYLAVGNYATGLPPAASAYWRLGMIYEIDGQIDQARAAFRSSLDLDPDHSNAKKALQALGK